ncbi:uncharacterized protein LOC112083519 [Eutrema salsugineum]|uniref:uncharacterized protein LOC112083519 n=1 Tax=Eutrema salsugineum TaxID=72664 RepID=UPI000CED1849|nr:uncharacterized protein LOC112083519 [Eutrema salsugineum]
MKHDSLARKGNQRGSARRAALNGGSIEDEVDEPRKNNQMKEMNELRATIARTAAKMKVVRSQVHRAISSALEIDRTTDPKEHIPAFQIGMGRAFSRNTPNLSEAERDAGFCLLFVEHLKSAALEWFSRLERNSINNFQQLSAVFLKQYSMFMDRGTSDADLWTLSQGSNEPLRAYMAWFKAVVLKVEGMSDKAALEALKRSLWYKSEFRREMALNTPLTFQDALHRSADFVMNEEEMKNLDEQYESTKAVIRNSLTTRQRNVRSNDYVHHEGPRLQGAHNYQVGAGRGKGPWNTWTWNPQTYDEKAFCKHHHFYGHSTANCRFLAARLAAKRITGEPEETAAAKEPEDKKQEGDEVNPRNREQGNRGKAQKQGRRNNEDPRDGPEEGSI